MCHMIWYWTLKIACILVSNALLPLYLDMWTKLALWCNFVLYNNIGQVNTQMASIIIEFYIDLSTSYPNNKLSQGSQFYHFSHVAACGFGAWVDIGRHKVRIWKGTWWFHPFDWWGLTLSCVIYHSFSLTIHISAQIMLYEVIFSSSCHPRCIHLIQVDIGLQILMKNAFRMVLNLKMLIRYVLYLILSRIMCCFTLMFL